MQDFFQFMSDNWPAITTFFVGLGGLIIRMTVLWEKLKPFIRFITIPVTAPFRISKSIDALNKNVIDLKSDIAALRTDVDGIKKELKTNGGSSLRDRIDDIRDLLEIQHNKLSFSLNHVNLCVVELDVHGNCIYSNKNCQKLFNLSEKEMLGKGWLCALDVNDANAVYNKFVESIKNDIPFKYRYSLKRCNNAIELSTTTIRNKNGKVLAVLAEITIMNDNNDD